MHPRHPDDVFVEDPRRLEAAVRRHGRHEAARGRRSDHRQDEPRRVRHGIEHRELGVRPDPQPARHEPGAGRLERWIGRRRGRRVRRARPRLRHRRFDPSAGGVVRGGRRQAHVRCGESLRARGLRIEPRPDRTVRQHGRRRVAAARDHLGSRPHGLDIDPSGAARHHPSARLRRCRAAGRPDHRSARRCQPRRRGADGSGLRRPAAPPAPRSSTSKCPRSPTV